MRTLVLAVMLTAGCGLFDAPTPEDRGIEVNYDIHKVYNQDKAMLMLEVMVEDYYDIKIDNRFQDTTVWWADTVCPYSDDPAVIYEGQCYYGRMWSCHEIYVALPKSGKTCGSALLHEFAHCLMLMHVAGSNFGDSEHVTDIWDVVAEANGIACDRGW